MEILLRLHPEEYPAIAFLTVVELLYRLADGDPEVSLCAEGDGPEYADGSDESAILRDFADAIQEAVVIQAPLGPPEG